MNPVEVLGGLPAALALLVFVVAFAEGIPRYGTLMPGQAILFAMGAVSFTREAVFIPVVAAAAAGAFAGDAVAYWGGRTGRGARFLRVDDAYPRAVGHGLATRPFGTLFMGRITTTTRAFMPHLAGKNRVTPKVAMGAAAVASVLYAAGSTIVGARLAAMYAALSGSLGIPAAATITLALLAVVTFATLKRFDPGIRTPDLAWILVPFLAFAGFLMVADLQDTHPGGAPVDAAAAAFIEAHAGATLAAVMPLVSDLGSAIVVAPLVALAGLILARRGEVRSAVLVVGIVIASQAIIQSLKAAIGRARPEQATVLVSDLSFPSGHTTTAAVLATLVFWLAYRHAGGRRRAGAALAIAILWVVAMAASRLVLGVHYFTDVVGGACLGIAIAAFGMAAPTLFPQLTLAALHGVGGGPGPGSGHAKPQP